MCVYGESLLLCAYIELHFTCIAIWNVYLSTFPIKVADSRKHLNKSAYSFFPLSKCAQTFVRVKLTNGKCRKINKNMADFTRVDYSLHHMMLLRAKSWIRSIWNVFGRVCPTQSRTQLNLMSSKLLETRAFNQLWNTCCNSLHLIIPHYGIYNVASNEMQTYRIKLIPEREKKSAHMTPWKMISI